jgi:hypothetical protein
MKKMKKFLIMLLLAVISLFLVFVAIAVAGEQVTFDGKKLIFPESSHLKPVEVSSSFEFDLGKIPKDKEFVIGKVFKIKFFKLTRKGNWPGSERYAVVTKWDEKKVEVFFYPTNPKAPDERPFLDCTPVCRSLFGKCAPNSDSTEYVCEIRGRTAGNTFSMTFGNQKIIITARDGAEARSEVVGEIPVAVTADQKKP